MYLFVDTESNGRARLKDTPAAYVWKWPRVVQIAWLLTDENGGELCTQSFIVRPDGFRVTKRIERERGITTETARRFGREISEVLDTLARDIATAEAVVGHNMLYDRRVIEAELHRLRRPMSPFTGKKLYCTMRTSTTLCAIRRPFGYKWPSLEELHRELFDTEFSPMHDALSDARACARCFFELKRRHVMADYALFEDIARLADYHSWFDRRFVMDVRAQFDNRGLTDRQRAALTRIRNMLAKWTRKRVAQAVTIQRADTE
jgi:DNA polymerase III subunit epsilon